MMQQSDGGNIVFEFKGVRLLLNCYENGVWRLRSEANGDFDCMGAAQTLAKDLGEEYEQNPLQVECETNGTLLTVKAPGGSFVTADGNSISFFDEHISKTECSYLFISRALQREESKNGIGI